MENGERQPRKHTPAPTPVAEAERATLGETVRATDRDSEGDRGRDGDSAEVGGGGGPPKKEKTRARKGGERREGANL